MKNYKIHERSGLIQQKEIVNKIQTYDTNYVETRYNTYGVKSMQMAYLRYGFMKAHCNDVNSILDVGYGNGDFLNVCKDTISHCYGNDISNYPLPTRCEFIEDVMSKSYDVVSFFDSLEHFEDIEFVKHLDTKYIYISVPHCHYNKYGAEWFLNWKHRREDEHLWHFTKTSLNIFMRLQGYEHLVYSDVEDIIRKPIDSNQNILTGIFKKI